MPDEPANPQPQPSPQPQPQPAPGSRAHPLDEPLPDDDDASARPTTRTVTQLRTALNSTRERNKELERENTELRGSSTQLETLRGQLVEQALIAHATGVLADPSDAVVFLKDVVKLDKDHKVDAKQVKAEIDKLVEARPHLKAGAGASTNGTPPARPLPNSRGAAPAPVGAGSNDAKAEANKAFRAGFNRA